MTEKLDQREIVERFQAMCNQQTQLSSKLAELEAERAEHEYLICSVKTYIVFNLPYCCPLNNKKELNSVYKVLIIFLTG
jgi:hypothetical protein